MKTSEEPTETIENKKDNPLWEIDSLLREGNSNEAFFLARRMAAEGIEGAEAKVNELLEEMRIG